MIQELEVHFGLDKLPLFNNTVLTIGTFDGVHHGHRAIIDQVVSLAHEVDGTSVLMTFDPHPRKVVFPNDDSLRLISTLQEKIKLLSETGIDHLVVVPFDISFSQINPSEYVDKILINKLRAKHVIIGYDHRFGLNRAGDFNFLKEYQHKGAFDLIEIPEQQINDLQVSSSKIRENLIHGRITEANMQLGHPYIISGIIKKGLKLAGSLGYPTANITVGDQDKLIPKLGTYAATCVLNNETYQGMLYIGHSTTLQEKARFSIEINIFHHFEYEFYGEQLEIILHKHIRNDQKFEDKEELLFNIGQDKIDCQQYFDNQNKIPECTVAVLNYNGREHLGTYVSNLKTSSSSKFDLVVIDNKSTDDSISYLREHHGDVQIIELTENHGFAGGYNEGLKQITTPYVALVNSDIEGTVSWLEPLIDMMNEDATIGAVQPKVRSYQEKEKFEYAGASGGFMDQFGFPFCRGRILDSVEEDSGQYDDIQEVFWTSGAAMIVRNDAFKKLRGFNKAFFAHMEEIDLCWRMKQLGYKMMINPKSTVYHLGGGTLSYGSSNKTFLNFRNNWWMMLRNLPSNKIGKFILVRILLDGAFIIKNLLTGQGNHAIAIIKAHWQIVTSIGTIKEQRRINRYHLNRATTDTVEPVRLTEMLLPWRYYVRRQRKYSEL